MVHALAHRVRRRLATIPQAILSYDDIVQELWIAWCKARDRFEPSRGIPWPAYLQRGMKQHINRVVDVHIERFEGQTFALSFDASASGGFDMDCALRDIVPNKDPLASDIVEAESNYDMAMAIMSDQARVFVSLLKEQPPQLLNEVLMAQDKAEHAATVGATYNAPQRITATMVFDLMGLTRTERSKVTKEVEKMGTRLSR